MIGKSLISISTDRQKSKSQKLCLIGICLSLDRSRLMIGKSLISKCLIGKCLNLEKGKTDRQMSDRQMSKRAEGKKWGNVLIGKCLFDSDGQKSDWQKNHP